MVTAPRVMDCEKSPLRSSAVGNVAMPGLFGALPGFSSPAGAAGGPIPGKSSLMPERGGNSTASPIPLLNIPWNTGGQEIKTPSMWDSIISTPIVILADGLLNQMLSWGADRNGSAKTEESKPQLVTNSKHHPNSESPQPSNFEQLYGSSIVDSSGVRWALDTDGAIHRFSKPSNNQSHWNGSTSGQNPILTQNIPIEIKRSFGVKK